MMTKIIFDPPWKLLDMGCVIHYNSIDPITLQIVENDGTEINIRFQFDYDVNNIAPELKIKMFNSNTALINITHSGSFVNFGSLNPITIGSFNEESLYFNFRISSNQKGDNLTLNYCWYTKTSIAT